MVGVAVTAVESVTDIWLSISIVGEAVTAVESDTDIPSAMSMVGVAVTAVESETDTVRFAGVIEGVHVPSAVKVQ